MPKKKRKTYTEKQKKVGRPSKYDPKYCQQLIKFFDRKPCRTIEEHFYYKNGDEKVKEIEVANEIPFFSAFAREIKAHTDTLNEWTKKHKEFSVAYKQAKELQKEFLVQNGLRGLYNATAFIFTAKNITDMRDVVEQKHSGEVKHKIDGFNYVNPKNETNHNSNNKARQSVGKT